MDWIDFVGKCRPITHLTIRHFVGLRDRRVDFQIYSIILRSWFADFINRPSCDVMNLVRPRAWPSYARDSSDDAVLFTFEQYKCRFIRHRMAGRLQWLQSTVWNWKSGSVLCVWRPTTGSSLCGWHRYRRSVSFIAVREAWLLRSRGVQLLSNRRQINDTRQTSRWMRRARFSVRCRLPLRS